MDKIIQDSIQELEMLHLQAEMEASEMERILAMSLALEEERLHLMQTEIEEMERNEGAYRATLEAKSSPGKVDVASSKNTADFNVADAKGSAGSSESSTCKDSKNQESTPVKLKPLKMKSEMKALPSIGAVKDVALELEEKRKQVDKQFKLNQDALQARKIQKEEVLAQATTSVKSKKELENAEAEARAAHMKAQRERIMLMKKREREEKVALEERNQKIQASESNEDDAKLEALRSIANKEAKGLSDEEIAAKQKLDESKRGAMRNALAARMKADLLSNLSSKSNGSADSQKFADLDAKIAEMDLLREENMRKEQDLTKTITSTLSQKNKS